MTNTVDVICELRTLERTGLAQPVQIRKAIWYLGKHPVDSVPEWAGLLPLEIAHQVLQRV